MSTSPHRKAFDPTAQGALADLRVIDLSRLVAGNLLTKVLADHGAEVIKVEPLSGDSLRAWKVQGIETAWKTWCRNKKSLSLDLHAEAGRQIVRDLAQTASVLVESFRPGVLEDMGLAPEALLAANPALVIVRVSGWGQEGPYRHKPGFGTLIEAYSGFAAVNGFEDGPPVLPQMYMADAYAGLYGATATMIALHAARGTFGRGQVIDLSLFEPLFSIMEPQIVNYGLTGSLKPRSGSRSTNSAPRNVYETRDGRWVALSGSTQRMAARLFEAIGRPELIDDPRFATNPDRLQNVEALDETIADFIRVLTLDEALTHFAKAGVTVGPIMDAANLAEDPYVIDREALIEVPDADVDWLPMHGLTPRLSGTPGVLARPAPALGEHNDEILTPVLGAEALAKLRAAGVIAP